MDVPIDWVENPPTDIESMTFILDRYGDELQNKGPRGDTLRYILNEAKREYERATLQVQEQEPQAYFKPSYEQSLLLNCWFYGVNFPVCFAANRIGKTTAFVFNGILWLFPNNPQWLCFKPYQDEYGRKVELLPRPPLQNLLKIQDFYQEYPELVGNPHHSTTESCNVAKTTKVKQLIPDLLTPAWPLPPLQKGGQIWLGAPDNEFHNRILRRRWRELLPKQSILKDSDSDHMFAITTASNLNPKTTAHEIISKSYESEDTKWSGDAVQGIMLTEGFDQDILDEVKNRVTNEAFASWDYTPAEARNVGRKTHLAYKVYKGKEELPLRSYVFTKFSVRTAPEHIIPKQKKADLIRMWEGKAQGKARLEGDFFSSSGLVLESLNREFHCLDWTFQELQERIPGGQFYRGLDPGFDHPTACAWGYLAPNNVWFIYRFYSKRGTTIQERCDDIISRSNNRRERFTTASGQVFWREVHPYPHSEVYVGTATDYHTFKTDETTGQNYANQYINNGLSIMENTHMKPEERAVKANSMLDPKLNLYLAHPERNVAPGSRVYFLTREPGVAAALDTFDQLFWDRYKAGEHKGEPKDKVPIHGDDELDALCNLICGPYVHTSYQPRRREPQEQTEQFLNSPKMGVATLQLKEEVPQNAPVGFY